MKHNLFETPVRNKTPGYILTISMMLMLLFFSCKKDSAFKTFQPKTTESIQILKDSNFVGLDLAATAAKQVNQSQLVSRIIAKKAVNGLNLPAGKQILDTRLA